MQRQLTKTERFEHFVRRNSYTLVMVAAFAAVILITKMNAPKTAPMSEQDVAWMNEFEGAYQKFIDDWNAAHSI